MKRLNLNLVIGGLCVVLGMWASSRAVTTEAVSLAGTWRFALDRADVGVHEQWATRDLADRITLPGVLQAQGYGDEISTSTPWVLSLYDRLWHLREDFKAYTQPGRVKVPFLSQPPRHYLGAAWYQRDIEIPGDWQGRRVVLTLERPRWETTVWVDDRKIGSNNSLVAPHGYDLGTLAPGRHRLSVRADNRMIMPYRPDAHAVSDSLGSSWNGIVGKIELTSTTPVWIDDAQVFPNVAKKSALVKVQIGNMSGKSGAGRLSVGDVTAPVTWDANGGKAELEVSLGQDAPLWDEFHPALHRLTVQLRGEQADDTRQLTFGLREFRAEGNEFVLNGRKTYLRGTHHGGDFPLTGYPPTDVEYWKKLIRTCQAWGLNHIRFHSFCPPEAAFIAADELGFYFQPEAGMWNVISPGTPMERMMYEETARMIKAYGNHPSFLLMSPSNEPGGRWKESLPKWVEHFRREDPRRLYTTGTGWSLIDVPGPVEGADYLAVHRIGRNMLRRESAWFGRDYGPSLRGVNVPVASHEVGQWCAYPDYDIIKKFTGYMRPGNYEIFRDSMAAHGLIEKNKDFAWASGRYQLACYKEEIEANLRTPGLGGFQLLDLHDYLGQGTALVGVLDAFWESKGYATAEEFRRFCSTTVPLARLMKRVFTTADAFDVDVEVAHYGAESINNAVAVWKVISASGATVANGAWPARTIPIGKNTALGKVTVDLSKLAAPQAVKLVVGIQGTSVENDWNFWLYPESPILNPQSSILNPQSSEVLVTSSWDQAETRLAAGGKVLFLPRPADLDWTSPPLDNVPIFWNRLMFTGWNRMLGLWSDVKHPALAGFPTEAYHDWQWAEVLCGSVSYADAGSPGAANLSNCRARAVNLDRLPRPLQPIVQAIDDWNRNWKLGLVFECKVGRGRLMVCSADLENALDTRPAARQLRLSLLDYMASERFQPPVAVTTAEIRQLLFDTQIMRKLGATAQADGRAANAIDGDPTTFWLVGGPRSAARHPHDLTISFPAPVSMSGLVLMPRQDHREHEGDIREYVIAVSDDGQQWREIKRGELPSSFAPKPVLFAQTVAARHLKLTALSGFGPDTSASLAELAVMDAGLMKAPAQKSENQAALVLRSKSLALPNRSLTLDGFYYETAQGRTMLPAELTAKAQPDRLEGQVKMTDGRIVRMSMKAQGENFIVGLSAEPSDDIIKWGLAVDALKDEYYTGLMERVVDGPQAASWAPGLTAAMNLRGQKVDMIVKPTTSVYAPFYLSSRGYAVFVKGTWPGSYDFCVADPQRVKIEFEGPSFEMKVYTATEPATLVRRHALDAGPPFLPPRWMFAPWRWRDEHTQRATYYDGTPVTGPFNSEVMEDVLMMKAFGIPCGVYWIDRPWGPGQPWGYDDFEIDEKRLPNFAEMVKWLDAQYTKAMLWIAPFFQGKMMEEALAKGYNLAGQVRPANGNNYPMVDMTNPAAKTYWQEGVAKLLKLGVAGFKLDRGEENIPDDGPHKLFDGRSIRENRNAYVAMYVKATYDIANKYRGNDVVLMPRGAYTGSSPYGVFWGGDVAGTQEGLRASIIAAQRAAVMGYPNWGSDTCGYGRSPMEQEVCGRWLAFSCFTPIMEVGPTRNVGFWNLPREPSYDAELIAIWRLYARLHQRLMDYGYEQAQEAHKSGMPIVRPLFLVDPKSPQAWANWWTYLYGPDLLVSPIWEKGKREQEVYLPSGRRWRDAWNPTKVYQGGQTITVQAELHQIPLFIRAGSRVELGDLNREYQESLAIARTKPDLKALDADVKASFSKRTSLKFDFGPGPVAPGYTQVLPSTVYSQDRGYGFEPGTQVAGVDRSTKDDMRGDFITGDKPFYFSVALPEGNYNLTVTFGDAEGETTTTVKAELRRLMLERVQTAKGRFETRTFTVNVRVPQIAGGGEVRLKDREKTTEWWAWDERLTLEFNDARPAVNAIEIARADDVPTIYLLGDSTVCDQPLEPYNSWGQMLTRFFKPGLAMANHAESGESLRSSLGARRLDKVMGLIKPGDYLFIQYGHNDMKEKGEGIGAFTSYKTDLKHFIAETRKRGGIPVLITPVQRRTFDDQGGITNSHGDYPEAVRQAAKEENVPLIDLHAMSKVFYEALGPEKSKSAFKEGDGSHHNNYGSYELAKCIVEGIKAAKLGVAQSLVREVPPFDPSRPDPLESFNVPASPMATTTTPEGR